MIRKLSIALLISLTSLSCSQFNHSFTSKTWHNMNAKYNATIDATAYLDYGLYKIDSVHADNFESVLEILPKIDSIETNISKPELEETIRLSSLVAERHSNSKHLDKAYLLLGKARLYRQDLLNSIEVFKYLNTNHKKQKSKTSALIWLMRAYLENDETDKATLVADEITTLELSKKDKVDFLLTRAALHQRNRDEQALSIAYLEEALKYMKKSPKKARAHFIAGQLFQQLDRGSLAYQNWKKVLKNRPSYEVEFNTRIELLTQASSLGANPMGSFQMMLEDRKNTDLKDKIYFKMGAASEKNGNFREAIEQYSQSVRLAKDKTLKANAYLRIAEINYGKFQDYEKASLYYDSTLQSINTRSENYEAIKNKSSSLFDFVRYHKVLRTEDSLQKLAAMNPLELEARIDSNLAIAIEEVKKQKLAEEAERRKLEENRQNRTAEFASGSGWLFYDQAKLTQSRAAFIRTWGTRILEDNWRRKTKELGSISFKIERNVPRQDEVVATEDEEQKALEAKQLAERQAKKETLLGQVPRTPDRLAASKRKQEEAYYQLGKIYKLQFQENDNARKTFVTLLDKFPETIYRSEVLYFLALMESTPNDNIYKTKLLQEFPFSGYAGQLRKGSEGVSPGTESQAQDVYAGLFEGFKGSEGYDQLLSQTEDALTKYSGTSIEDKLAMLRIMLLAKNRNNTAYRIALVDFVKSYPNSSLKQRVTEMLAAITKDH